MKSKLFLSLVIVVFSYINSYAQDSIPRKYIITFAPLTIIDPVNHAVQIGLEMNKPRKYSVYIDCGIITPHIHTIEEPTGLPRDKGFRLVLGYKYFPFSYKIFKYVYLSPEVFYLHTNSWKIKRFYSPNDSIETFHHYSSEYTDTIRISRETYGISIRGGFEFQVRRFNVDVFAGIGIKHRLVEHHDKMKPEDLISYYFEPNFEDPADDTANGWTLNPKFGVKIGYVFWQRR